MPIHLSVQANTVNWAVKFWQKVGVTRIILSRELSLDEIAMIRQECPDMELEVFVHGALCIAYSGRCLLSGYFNRRDPNRAPAPTPAAGTTRRRRPRPTEHRRGDCRQDGRRLQLPESGAAGGRDRLRGLRRQPAASKADQVYLIEESRPPRPADADHGGRNTAPTS